MAHTSKKQNEHKQYTEPMLDLHNLQTQIQINGAFSPLHWLLQAGYLPYPDYEAWRHGKQPSLDGLLSISEHPLSQLIDHATEQAQALNLSAEPQCFYAWNTEKANQTLQLSNNAELANWLGQRWVRPEDLPQLDLFMDGGAATAENDLRDLLCQRRWPDAEKAYHHLSAISPNNSHLADYENLILYGKHMSNVGDIDEEQAEEELHALLEDIAPTANELLQHQASDYLSVAWRRLARYLPKSQYHREKPKFHASYALAQLPDWPSVIESIQGVSGFDQHPALIMRLAEAYWHQQPEIAMLLWCRIIDLDEKAENSLDAIDHHRFRDTWDAFGELDLSIVFFPAYLLICHPGLIHHLQELPTPKPRHSSFSAVNQLLHANGKQEKEVSARKALKATSPTLLKVYLKEVSVC